MGDFDWDLETTQKTIRGDGKGSLGRIDKYELTRELGGGGFGAVYLAHDTVAQIDRAVKGLPPEVKGNPEELENVRENFALVSRLHHPHIAAALDLHLAESVQYFDDGAREKLRVSKGETLLVMEYAPGVTLSQWRKQFPGRKVPLGQALEITRQVAEALDYAHGQKIIHRDVKPTNVMVEAKPDGSLVVRVLDFGLAAEIRSSMGRVSREVRDTSGTRPYMAPEQWLGERQDAATDQYALAVMFYELLTGGVPFASAFETNDAAVMMNAVTTRTPEIPEDLPRHVRAALAKALAKKPEERFASCGEFAAALAGCVKVKGAGIGSGAKAALAAVCVAALAVAGILLWRGIDRQSEKDVTLGMTGTSISAKQEEKRREAEGKRQEREEAVRWDREASKLAKNAIEENRKAGMKTITLPGGVEMRFRWCPPGSFLMGSPTSEEGRFDDETQHHVTLTKGFWMAETEVTQKQWQSVMGSNPSHFRGNDRPVEQVSWNDCQEFIKKVNARLSDMHVRLPTEAEWEYACRAGTTGTYGGTGNLDEMGWYSGRETHPVGQKKPNAWGLYDMHGNVCEWCEDWYGDYPTGNGTDPTGPASGSYRVLRGGCWYGDARLCRSALRLRYDPGVRYYYVGFRLLCSAGPRDTGTE